MKFKIGDYVMVKHPCYNLNMNEKFQVIKERDHLYDSSKRVIGISHLNNQLVGYYETEDFTHYNLDIFETLGD